MEYGFDSLCGKEEGGRGKVSTSKIIQKNGVQEFNMHHHITTFSTL
jgi:hypothetical protein